MPSTSPSSDVGLSSDDILSRLSSTDVEIKLKAIREVKNKIIGNRTKKLSYIKHGVVPAVAAILAEANVNSVSGSNLIVQSAAALGSFACGLDAGVRAVLDAGAFPNLISLLSSSNEKVVDAAARSLRMIYQSKMAPKHNFLEERNMEFILSLLSSENENFTGLGASVIIHSCQTNAEQNALCDAGGHHKLIYLLEGSLCQRDSSLESLAAIVKNNPEAVSKFVDSGNGRALSSVIELLKDRYPRTRLLACICLIWIRNTSSCYLQDIGIKNKLVNILLELLDDAGQVGDEASFAFSALIQEKEDLQKLAFEANAIDKLYSQLHKVHLQAKRHEVILLALADLCSKLEICRSRFLSLQVLEDVIDALSHDLVNIRVAACMCIRSVSRSIKSLSAGCFLNEKLLVPLIHLLSDSLVQVAALGAISNIVVDFTACKLLFKRCGGMKELVQLSKCMDPTVRSNSLWALKNFVFLAERTCKQELFMGLTASSIGSLIGDPEPSVQEQALALVRNLVDGCIESIEYIFAEDGIILEAIRRLLQNATKAEIAVQGMYVLSNVASGNELHKEVVMKQLIPEEDNVANSFIVKFMQSEDSHLRTAAIWVVVNLTCPSSPAASSRVVKLRTCGIISQIKSMVNDPCLDVKLRVRTVLGQIMTFGENST